MTAYFLCGFVLLAALLALQLRLVLRIWARLRWTHPSVHAVGIVQNHRRDVQASLLQMPAGFAAQDPRADDGLAASQEKDGKQ